MENSKSGYTGHSLRCRVCIALSVACLVFVVLPMWVDAFDPLAGPLLLVDSPWVLDKTVAIVQTVILMPMILAFAVFPRRMTLALATVGLVGWLTWGVCLSSTGPY